MTTPLIAPITSLFSRTKPVVGISGANADSASVRAMMTQIAASGATPVFLGNHGRRDPAKDIQKIDSLIVMGNNSDIDPARYGEARHASTKSENDTPEGKARAEYETQLMQLALDSKMPLMGVCGGMHRLNVMRGGSLHQDLVGLLGNNTHAQQDNNIAPFIPVVPIHIEKSSTLGKIGETISTVFAPWHRSYSYKENSMHHQAVNKVGNGLRAVAHADDKLPDGSNLVEAIEADPNGPLKDQFVLAVQWHPEFSASDLGAKIAKRVVHEAHSYAQKNDRRHSPAEAERENILSALDRVKPEQQSRAPSGGMTEMILSQRAQQRAAMIQ